MTGVTPGHHPGVGAPPPEAWVSSALRASRPRMRSSWLCQRSERAMPRRRPSKVRTRGSACGTHRAVSHHVPGLGHRPMAAVITLEHTRMWPGAVAAALTAWQEAALTGTADRVFFKCECRECTGDAPRRRLQRALIGLPPWARPHLYALVLPVDLYYLRRTSPMPPTSPDSNWTWWQQRSQREDRSA